MRLIEKAMINAIKEKKDWKGGNTRVDVQSYPGDDFTTIRVIFHRTAIATIEDYGKTGRIVLDNGGYTTATTKSRINAILQGLNLPHGIYQKNFNWYLTGPEGTVKFFKDATVRF
jgi:hypothetical protein